MTEAQKNDTLPVQGSLEGDQAGQPEQPGEQPVVVNPSETIWVVKNSPEDGASAVPQSEVQAEASGSTGVPAGETFPAKLPPKPSLIQRLFRFLYRPDTRLGRFMRKATRWAAIGVSLFALGVLAVYLGLYQPVEQERSQIKATHARLVQTVTSAEVTLEAARRNLAEEQARSQRLNSEQGSRLDNAASYSNFLQLLNQVNSGRLALAKKDGAAAVIAFREMRTTFAKFLPLVQAQDAALANGLKALFDLAQADLSRDPRLAQEDLDRLYADLLKLESMLFK